MLSAAALGAALLAPLAACGDVGQTKLEFTDTEDVAITEVRLEPGSGDITVSTKDDIKQVEIKRVVRYRGDEPEAKHRIEGTALVLDAECRGWCSVSYLVVAPKGVAVRGSNDSGDLDLTDVSAVDVEVGSGDITVRRASGAVAIDTGSGNVTVSEVTGDATLKTGSGTVAGTDLRGARNAATTDSGDIHLTLGKPGAVQVHSGSGDVEVSVPRGDYRVDARTDSGDTAVDVPNTPGGAHLLDLKADSGDLTLRYA